MKEFLWGKYYVDYYENQEQAKRVTDLKYWEKTEGLFSKIPADKLKLRKIVNFLYSGLCTEMGKSFVSSIKHGM